MKEKKELDLQEVKAAEASSICEMVFKDVTIKCNDRRKFLVYNARR